MCTAATYKTKDFYFGRTLDYEFSYNEEVTITPRNYKLKFRHGIEAKNNYAIIGMAFVVNDYPLYYDAINEKGLGMAGLNFVGNAVYSEVKSDTKNVAQYEFIPWILRQCESVKEARKVLSEMNLVGTQFSEQLPAASLHWIIADANEAITVESTESGLHVYDNPVGVLTNNPPFEQQMFQLNNYMHLSSKQPTNSFSDNLQLNSYSRGMGAIGMPGDLSSGSRFVRVAFTKMNSKSGETENESEFSTVLSRFVKEKDVNVYRLAKYCGYDRANLYKVMRGERKPPSLEVLNLLCEYMHLSPAEEEILEENYEITMVGHDNYYRRKNVMKFFSDFSMTSNLENVLPTVEIKEDFEIPNSSYMLLRGNYEINSALFHIIADETKNQKGHIQILAQPEHALGNLLAMRGNTSNEIIIDHIICLDNKPEIAYSKSNYTLDCLKHILPLYNYNYDYNTWYYYADLGSLGRNFSVFPYMILTSKYVCMLSDDLQDGYLSNAPELIKMMKERFEKYRRRAHRLVENVQGEIEQQYMIMGMLMANPYPKYAFHMSPCMMAVLDRELIEKYLEPQLPQREELVKVLCEYISNLQKQDMTYVCSMEGILQFIETGIISEFPKEMYQLPDKEDRMELVKRLFDEEKAGKVHILKKNIGDLKAELYLCITPESGLLRFAVPSKNVLKDISLEESGLVSVFYDFCENLSPELFYSEEEAKRIIFG